MDSGGLNVEPRGKLTTLDVMGTGQPTHAEYASTKRYDLVSIGAEEHKLIGQYFLQLLQWCARGGLYRLHMRQNLGPPVFFLTS